MHSTENNSQSVARKSTIASTISRIVKNRKDVISPIFRTCWDDMKSVIEFADSANLLVNSENWKILLRDYPDFKDKWDVISTDVTTFINCVLQNVGVKDNSTLSPKGFFETIYNKINKNEIEVCITGPVSTGKSTFLRALTGAPETVIPSGESKTTAARSVFNNSPSKTASVYFYNKDKFKDVINEYVTQLNKVLDKNNITLFPEWNPSEQSIEEFCETIKNMKDSYKAQNFSKLPIDGVGTIVGADKYFQTFKLYIDNVSQYKKWLGHPVKTLSTSEIEQGDLKPYVSYINPDGSTNLYCRALAVSEAIINWPLRTLENEDLGSLKLVDTMGIGEAKFAVEQDLLSIIREHADLAIALCRYESATANQDKFEDSSFIKVLSEIKDRQMKDWFYYLCNKEDGVEITDEKVNSYRNHLWNEMTENSDGFSLNKNYWRAINFVKEGDNNSEAIVQYFSNVVLGELDNNITKVDEFFLTELQKLHDKAISDKEDIVRKLKDCLDVLPAFSDIEKTEAINSQVDNIFNELRDALSTVREELNKRDEELRIEILKSIKPILKNPEIFNVYKVEGLDYNEKSAFKSLFKCSMQAINEGIAHSHTLPVSWDEIKNRVIEYTKKIYEGDNNLVDSMFKSEEQFFIKYLELSSKAIQTSMYSVQSNHDDDNPAVSINDFGRELSFFIKTREKLYERIWEKMSIASDKTGIKDSDTNAVKEMVCKTIVDCFVKNELIQKPNGSSIEWLKKFAESCESDMLRKEILDYIDAEIHLPSIVRKKAKEDLRYILLNVNLQYTDESSAAKSIWGCLSTMDILLRNGLLEKYEEVFKTYHIYVNMANPIFDKIFCVDQANGSLINSKAYSYLYAYISNIVRLAFEKKDDSKCADAATKYRELCK